MKQVNVALLEDNEIDRELYSLAFERLGEELSVNFEIEYLVNFRELKDFCHHYKTGLSYCIFDLIIDEEKSFPYISLLREKDPDLPILVLSSSAYEGDINMSFENGATDFSMKPISFEALCELLKKATCTYSFFNANGTVNENEAPSP